MFVCNKCKAIYTKNDDGVLIPYSYRHCHHAQSCGDCENNIIELDDEAVPMVIGLWEKGYQTMFSCSGHPITRESVAAHDFTMDTYVLIDTTNLKQDFIDHIVNDIYSKKKYNLVVVKATESILNNIETKCIRIGVDMHNPELRDIIWLAHGNMQSILQMPADRVSTKAYSCLCKLRAQIADLITALPYVRYDNLIDEGKVAFNSSNAKYDCKYDPVFVERTLEKYPQARRDVLTFISAVGAYAYAEDTEKHFRTSIETLFGDGFCYYFALMLHDAFGGTIVWHNDFAHVLWMDENKIVYDIYGVYDGDIPENFTPFEKIEKDYPEMAESFKHRTINTP